MICQPGSQSAGTLVRVVRWSSTSEALAGLLSRNAPASWTRRSPGGGLDTLAPDAEGVEEVSGLLGPQAESNTATSSAPPSGAAEGQAAAVSGHPDATIHAGR